MGLNQNSLRGDSFYSLSADTEGCKNFISSKVYYRTKTTFRVQIREPLSTLRV